MSFADIVEQDELKQALLAVAANDDLNGLLIAGEKGTAKSTAVRALADLLPPQDAVEDCPYGCSPELTGHQCPACRDRTNPPTVERPVPLVTLPLGATREHVVGTLSVADALNGDYEFDPGLLARAHRGILYVDEVNLLDDHLVDVLLDAAASGVNRVERDGVSVSHPAAFTLVGTMNPEEGDLRPQLRDRFALQTTVTACDDIGRRVEIIDRAIGRADGDDASEDSRARTREPRDRLRQARDRLGDVRLSTEFAEEIAELCRDAGVDGHRGDIATARAAMTFAALDGRSTVIESDVRRAAELALRHRLRSRPFEEAPDAGDVIDDHFDGDDGADADGEGRGRDRSDGETADNPAEPSESSAEDDANDASGRPSPPGADTGRTDGAEAEATESEQEAGESDDGSDATPIVPGQSRVDVGEGRAPELSAPDAVDDGRADRGDRSRAASRVDDEGARVRLQRTDSSRRVDAAASVRAAAARGSSTVESHDLRRSVRRSDGSALVLFVVDASASMRPAMRAAKGTVLELLKEAYQRRDEVAFVAFAGDGADVLLPPTDSVTLAARHLKTLPTGDRTPLPAGLRTAGEVLERADPAASVVVLVTDGRANVADESPVRETREAAGRLAGRGAHVVVVDAGDDDGAGVAALVADETEGERVPLSALSAERIDATVGVACETEI